LLPENTVPGEERSVWRPALLRRATDCPARPRRPSPASCCETPYGREAPSRCPWRQGVPHCREAPLPGTLSPTIPAWRRTPSPAQPPGGVIILGAGRQGHVRPLRVRPRPPTRPVHGEGRTPRCGNDSCAVRLSGQDPQFRGSSTSHRPKLSAPLAGPPPSGYADHHSFWVCLPFRAVDGPER
jgi:hypothetical protein